MPKTPRFPALLINFFMAASLVVIWIAFAPVNIGGSASYVMVNGNSMEPGFHKGDLAIVRAADDYQVGDIVTYHDAQMAANVIHRIIAVDGDRFELQGDNNSWIDAYHPTRAEIVGKLWIHAPKLADGMLWLRTPLNMALAAAAAGGFLMMDVTVVKPRQNGRKKNKKTAGNSGGSLELGLYGFGFLVLLFLALSIFAFTRPLMRASEDFKYTQTAVFFYSAAATPGIYDSASLRSGEPIFPKLTCSINIGSVYNLVGDQVRDVSGSHQLNAIVTDDQSGWQRTIPLSNETAFNGNSVTSIATLDLCQVQSLLASVEKETGFHPGTYTLTVVPRIAINATTAGQNLTDTFEPKLVFNFDSVHFYLASGNKPGSDPLRFSKEGLLKNTATQANTIALPGLQLRVVDLRVAGLLGLGFSLACLLVFGWFVFDKTRGSQESLIQMKYGAMLMEVYDHGFDTISPCIDVTTIDDLAKLAERQNAMILHMTRDRVQYYLVQVEGAAYRFVISDGRGSLPKTDASPAADLG